MEDIITKNPFPGYRTSYKKQETTLKQRFTKKQADKLLT